MLFRRRLAASTLAAILAANAVSAQTTISGPVTFGSQFAISNAGQVSLADETPQTFKCNSGTSSGPPSDCPWSALPAGPNILLNGGMALDQANEGASVSLATGAGAVITDGWKTIFTSATAGISAQRVTDAPGGLSNSLKVTVGTGAASVGSTDVLRVTQNVEANQLAATGFGTASVQPLCVTWWWTDSIGAQTIGVFLSNGAGNRFYTSSFVSGAANTWAQYAMCLPGDAGGTWVTSGTGKGIIAGFAPGVGSGLQTASPNAWSGTTAFGPTGMGNALLTTNGATFEVSGVKLEISALPTAFRPRDFAAELVVARRQYEKSWDLGTAVGSTTANGALSVVPESAAGQIQVQYAACRGTPTLTPYSPNTGASGKVYDATAAADVAAATGNVGTNAGLITFTATAGHVYQAQWTKDCRL